MESLLEVELALSSPEFDNGGSIPKKYTCDGKDVNPPIKVENLPEDTATLALIIEDPDAPNGTFDHWVVWNINPYMDQINENVTPGVEGKNSFGKHHYKGPCPANGEHRYFFRVYALNKSLKLPTDAGKIELLDAMEGNVLASGELMGRYKKSS